MLDKIIIGYINKYSYENIIQKCLHRSEFKGTYWSCIIIKYSKRKYNNNLNPIQTCNLLYLPVGYDIIK